MLDLRVLHVYNITKGEHKTMVNIVKEVNIAELAYLSGYLDDMR